MPSEMQSYTANFKNAPLVQAICRLILDKDHELSVKSLSRLVARLKDDFDDVDNLQGYQIHPGTQSTMQIGGLLGATFTDSSSGVSVALQPNLVSVSWSKSDLSSIAYPRFPTMTAKLWALFDAWTEVLLQISNQKPTIHVVNLAYADLIIEPNMSLGATASKYFTNQTWNSVMNTPGTRSFETQWREPNDTDFRCTFQRSPISVQNSSSPEVNAYMVEWSAGRVVGPSEIPRDALTLIHGQLLESFMQSLSSDALSEWGHQSEN